MLCFYLNLLGPKYIGFIFVLKIIPRNVYKDDCRIWSSKRYIFKDVFICFNISLFTYFSVSSIFLGKREGEECDYWSFLLKMFLCNYFNNLRLAVLPNFPFTTSETMRDYYLWTWYTSCLTSCRTTQDSRNQELSGKFLNVIER